MKPLVLFVCTGNLCRSPMAAALLKAALERAGDADRYEIASAGTWAPDGAPATDFAQRVMEQRGLSLRGHRARTLFPELLDRAALILVMTENHRDSLGAEFPAVRSKIHLMSELGGRRYDIADPYTGTFEEYESCAAELAQLAERGYSRLDDWLASTRLESPASD